MSAKRERVGSSTDDDVPLDSLGHGFFEAILCVAGSRQDLTGDRAKRSHGLSDEQPIEKSITADALLAHARQIQCERVVEDDRGTEEST